MQNQLDLIFFVYGLGFLLLATLCASLHGQNKGSLPWKYLALFGLLHGVNEWLDMLAISLGGSPTFEKVRLAVMALSYLPLLEFGRRGLKAQGLHLPGGWIFFPLLVCAGLGGWAGMNGLNAGCRYALGFPGGLLAGWALWRQGGQAESVSRWPLRLAGLGLLAYAPATGLIVPSAAFFPASILNHETFLAFANFPIQLVRALCAVTTTLGIWLAYSEKNTETEDSLWFRRWAVPCLLLLLLVGGGWGTQWFGQRADDDQRQALLNQTSAIAHTINPERVKALSFSSRDKTVPEFQRLGAQMMAYAQALNFRSIYSMVQRDGRVVFGPESLAEDDPIATPPGTVYRQPPAELSAVFQTRQALTAGPYKDEYGEFITAYAPLLDPRTGDLLTVIAMDVEAGPWQAAITRARLLPILFTLIVMVILLAGFGVLEWRKHFVAGRQGRLRYTEALLCTAVGLAISSGVGWLVQDVQSRSRRDSFAALAQAQSRDVEQLLFSLRSNLDIISRYFESDERVTRREFRHVTKLLVRQGLTDAWQWIPRVPAQEMAQVVAEARQDGLADFAIWQKDSQGNRQPAAGREDYYPVFYSEPKGGIENAIGYDLGSDPVLSEELRQIARNGMVAAIDPVTSAQDTAEQQSLLAVRPVYAMDKTPRQLLGFAVAQVRLDSMIRHALTPSANQQSDISAGLFQLEANHAPRLLAAADLDEARHHIVGNQVRYQDVAAGEVTVPIFIFGKAYVLLAHPEPAWLAAHPVRNGWWAGLAGLLLTGVLSGFIGFLVNRRADLQRKIQVRTAEMAEEKQRLNVTLRSIGDGVIATDTAGRVTLMNGLAELMTGWSEAEAAGKNIEDIFNIIDQTTRQRRDNPVREVLATGVAVELADHTILVSREEIPTAIADSCAPIRDESGDLQGVVLVFRDVTETSLAGQALRENEAQLHAIFENAPLPMLLVDRNRVVRRANHAAGKLSGDGWDAMIGKRGGEALHCISAINNQGGCGFGAACAKCVVKETVLDTFQTLRPHHQVEAMVRVAGGGRVQEVNVLLSTSIVVVGGEPMVLACLENVTQRKAMEEELRIAARIDRLTGLPNRTLLLDRLQNAIERHKRSSESRYAVLFLDFDRFKTVNDSLGHEVGDQLLCAIAQRLKTAVRTVDSVSRQAQGITAARLGGDEFVILLDMLQAEEDAGLVTQRLLDTLAAPYQLGGHEVVSTASIGYVTSEYGHERAEDVLRDADTAMYEAKLAGRGRAILFDGSMRDRVQRKLELENGLRKALETDQFLLHYQPIISLETRRREGFEALVRWLHPRHGLISPGEFIPVAEETGLIVPLGEWIFRAACRQLAAWWRTHGREAAPSISINLSRNQIVLPELPQRLLAIAQEEGADPAAIHLEVTESAIMADTKLANQVLQQIKALGFKIDMDDFGTGYSSLACLHQFPIDVLKIDRSFIANLDRGPDFAALVNAITMLARNLGITVIAEGVETEGQVILLQALDCQLAQGYFFARPMPAEQLDEYLAKDGIPAVAEENAKN